MRSACSTVIAALAVFAAVPVVAPAQDSGPGTGGAMAIARLERSAGNWKRVLMIGAHPDDEYTDLIALLSRREGMDVAYLSLTRGEGGQNLIGNELGVALGLLRTEELLAARRVDGAQQFFTTAFDFGYSKTAEETFRFWPRERLLEDVVRVIRRFRPQVIVSVWSGTPRDGHGQHTVSGIIAREAFDAAADSARFPILIAEGLRPYRPAKLYLGPYTLPATTPFLILDAGAIEPASGLSFHQLAARSRSRHRSQDMGQLEEPGPWPVRIALEKVASGITASAMDPLFAGISPEAPTTLSSVGPELALARANVVVDAYADDDEVAVGQSAEITLRTWNAGTAPITAGMSLGRAAGWSLTMAKECDSMYIIPPGEIRTCKVRRQATATEAVADRPDNGMFPFPDYLDKDAFPTDLWAVFCVATGSEQCAHVGRVVEGRFLNQALGEVRRPLVRVPRVSLAVEPSSALWRSSERFRTVRVHVEHLARDTTDAAVQLVAADGWKVSRAQPVHFTREGERVTLSFNVTAPVSVRSGEVTFAARAVAGGDTTALSIHRIDYPHIRRRTYFTTSDARIVVAPVLFPTRTRIGYVRGAADLIPEALRNSGVRLTLLNDDALAGNALDSIDVLVIGPRAYEVNDALRRAHPRVLDWVNRGGTLIVQYQQYQYIRGGFAPRPFTISQPHDRVTDENAAVTLLTPNHRLFRYPNVITARDFDGWRQERGLYFAGTWDAAWTPLLEMHDPGEEPRRGGLLLTTVGRGRVVYTGIAFFRQIPAAVPGAWRLFANLLALGEPRAQ